MDFRRAASVLGLIVWIAFLVAAPVSHAGSGELYYWTDEAGKVHIVDRIDLVPRGRRIGVREERVSKHPREGSPVQVSPEEEGASPEVQPEHPDKVADSSVSEAAKKDEEKRIEALRGQKDELEAEKVRQQALKRRFKSSSVRSRVYGKRVEELDKKIELIEKELEASSSKVP
ncbi:MAG: DUF4124 domain-containing protein [Deltaproteobacteria bacterium]|nr:DUF4124 domain-containing protein [Deltaproteobacteria bacterium]